MEEGTTQNFGTTKHGLVDNVTWGNTKLTWTTLRTQIPQNDDSLFALFDGTRFHSLDEIILAVEGTCFTHERQPFFSCDFGDSPPRSEISFKNSERRRELNINQRSFSRVRT